MALRHESILAVTSVQLKSNAAAATRSSNTGTRNWKGEEEEEEEEEEKQQPLRSDTRQQQQPGQFLSSVSSGKLKRLHRISSAWSYTSDDDD